MGSINPLIWSSWVDLHKVVLVESLRDVMRLMFMVALLRMCNSVCKHDSMESFEWLLIKLSLLSSPVLVSDHFQRICLFVSYATNRPKCESSKKGTWLMTGIRVVSVYNRQLDKEPIWNCVFRHFVISSLSQKHCSHFFSWIYKKMSELFDRHKLCSFLLKSC